MRTVSTNLRFVTIRHGKNITIRDISLQTNKLDNVSMPDIFLISGKPQELISNGFCEWGQLLWIEHGQTGPDRPRRPRPVMCLSRGLKPDPASEISNIICRQLSPIHEIFTLSQDVCPAWPVGFTDLFHVVFALWRLFLEVSRP